MRINKALLFSLAFLISACTVQKPYHRPMICTPDHWRLSTNQISLCANVDWWKQFCDPVLDCYIATALENNKDLKVAIHRVGQAAAQLCIKRSYFYPEVNGDLVLTRQEVSQALRVLPAGTPRVQTIYYPFLSASYELDLWQKIRSAADAALAELLATVEARRGVVLTVVSAVASTYMEMRRYDQEVLIATDTLRSREESYRLARLRYEGGLTSLMEVCQAESLMQEAAAMKVQLELLVALQENQLSILMGANPRALCRGLSIDQLEKTIFIPMGLPSELLCQRPDILQAEDQLRAAHARVGEAKALFFPQVSLTAAYGSATIDLSTLFSNPAIAWSYGMALLQPIFNANRISCGVKAAVEVRYQALYNYQQTILNAFKEVNDALISEHQSAKLIVVQTERVAALAEYLKLATLRYNEGEVDYLNVLDAERTLFRAQLDLVESQAQHLVSYVDLFKSLGGGWVTAADRFMLKSNCPQCP